MGQRRDGPGLLFESPQTLGIGGKTHPAAP